MTIGSLLSGVLRVFTPRRITELGGTVIETIPDGWTDAAARARAVELARTRGPVCLDGVDGRVWAASADGSLVELGASGADQ